MDYHGNLLERCFDLDFLKEIQNEIQGLLRVKLKNTLRRAM